MDERWRKAIWDAESTERLLELARAEGVDLSLEKATELFEKYHPPLGELTDRELEDVAGGGCGTPPRPNFQVGDHVMRDGCATCEDYARQFFGSCKGGCASPFWTVTNVIYKDIQGQWSVQSRCPNCGFQIDPTGPKFPIHIV